MTGWELLAQWAGLPAPRLRELFVVGRDNLPDLAPTLDEKIVELDGAVTIEAAMRTAAAVFSELGQIGQGKFSGTTKVEDLS